MRWRITIAVTCAALLAMTACSDQPDVDLAESTAAASETQRTASVPIGMPSVEQAVQPTPVAELRSPLTIALSNGNSVGDLNALIQQEAQLREEFMWECMAADGFGWFDRTGQGFDQFEYTFDDSPIPAITNGTYGIVPDDIDIDWAIENIYGRLVAPRAPEPVNPTIDMSDQESEVFWGRAEDCSARADDQVQLQAQYSFELLESMSALDERIASDPRSVSALSAWSRCMHDAGYDYDTPQESYSDVNRDFSFLRPSIVALPDELLANFRELSNTNPDEALQIVRNAGTIDERLFELQHRERVVAAADENCRGPLAQVLLTVRDEHENRFIADNADLIAESNSG